MDRSDPSGLFVSYAVHVASLVVCRMYTSRTALLRIIQVLLSNDNTHLPGDRITLLSVGILQKSLYKFVQYGYLIFIQLTKNSILPHPQAFLLHRHQWQLDAVRHQRIGFFRIDRLRFYLIVFCFSCLLLFFRSRCLLRLQGFRLCLIQF